VRGREYHYRPGAIIAPARPADMKQLSGADSMFLQLERGTQYMHVATLALYDPSTAPGGGVRFKDVLRFFTARVTQFPQFRRRLVSLPFSLDRPYWIEDAPLDVEFHVRHIALPYPGDWRQLCIQVARLHSRPLDRSKPLWEAYVIEGLHHVDGVPSGAFALYTKMHHAIVDGESGMELIKALHTVAPEQLDEADLADEPAADFVRDREPTLRELYSRAAVHSLQRLPTLARFSVDTARKVVALGANVAASRARSSGDGEGQEAALANLRSLLSGDLSQLLPRMPPQTRFSGPVSAHRVFEAVSLSLDDFRAIRCLVPQATINDQFLCVVGGALRSYLAAKNEALDASMVSLVPMSLRGADKGGDHGVQVGFTMMPVHTEIEAPLERLRAIVESSSHAKRMTGALGKELARDLLETLPSVIAEPLLRNLKMPGIGLIISNVRGPEMPLYMAGARLVNYVPISIVIDGLGLNVTGFSYAGRLWICAVSCRDMLPDPSFLADCLRDAFDRMKQAAAEEAALAQAEPVAVRKGKRRPAKPVQPAEGVRHKKATRPNGQAESTRKKRAARRSARTAHADDVAPA
jgi:WS/DGAT/MGAT family acyltransferase